MSKSILWVGAAVILVGVLALVLFEGKDAKEEVKGEEIIANESNTMNETEALETDVIITLKTSMGEIAFKTFPEDAPNTVKNFVELASKGFYNGVIFHRVIDGFMIQGGDPTGTGRGGPGYAFNDEINPDSELYKRGYKKGVVAMANAGPNTQGSQFFIMTVDYPLPPNYTIFGEVVAGQDVVDAIALVERDMNDKPLQDVVIQSVSISGDSN